MNQAEVSLLVKARDEASAVLGKIRGAASNLQGTLQKGLRVGAIAAAGGIGLLGIAAVDFVGEAMEAQKVAAQTAAVIKSTGGAAGLSAKQISDMAGALSKVTTFEDDAIQSGQNILLTFTKIGKDVFPQATETMLDMSTALGQDLQSSAIQLGKALNDPIRGVTALRRVGVSFTEEQLKQIKVMQESGDVMGAQKLILKELQTEFGNSARAAGDTFAGKVAILKNQVGELKESIGMALLPVLSRLADFGNQRVVPMLEKAIAQASAFADFLSSALAGDVESAARAFGDLAPPLQKFALWLVDNKPRIDDIAETIRDLAQDAIAGWVTILRVLLPQLKELGEWLVDHEPVLIAVAVAAGLVLAAIIGWPAVIAAIIIGIGLLTTKIQEWRRENEDLDDTLTAIEFTLRALGVTIAATTKFIDDHKWAQSLLIGEIKAMLAPLFNLIALIGFLGDAARLTRNAIDGISNAFDRLAGKIRSLPDIPDWLKKAGGIVGKATGAIDDVLPHGFFAQGGILPRGVSLVGEQGPELVFSGTGGERVFSNADSRRMLGGGTVNNYEITVDVHIDGDATDRTVERIKRAVREEAITSLREATFGAAAFPSGAYLPSGG